MIQRIAARRLSSDERELNRFKEEDRKKLVKKLLESRRKKMNDDIWRGRKGNAIYAKNIIKDDKNLFKDGNLLKSKINLLRQPSIFMR